MSIDEGLVCDRRGANHTREGVEEPRGGLVHKRALRRRPAHSGEVHLAPPPSIHNSQIGDGTLAHTKGHAAVARERELELAAKVGIGDHILKRQAACATRVSMCMLRTSYVQVRQLHQQGVLPDQKRQIKLSEAGSSRHSLLACSTSACGEGLHSRSLTL